LFYNMANSERDVEHHANSSSTALPPEPESSISSERLPLLRPELHSNRANYKTTSVDNSWAARQEVTAIPTKSPISVLSLLLIAVFISHADGSLMIATYVTISSEFDAFGAAAWLTTSYTLAMCAVQPLAGKLSDIYGRKAVLLSSYIVFTLGLFVT